MRVSEACLQMIKDHEGLRRKPYTCPAQLWTVGYGHVLYPEQAKLPVWTGGPKGGTRLDYPLQKGHNRLFTNDEIHSFLEKDIRRFEVGVLRYCRGPFTQGQFDALVSFSFNAGLGNLQRSTLRMKHNRGEKEAAAKQFMRWTKGGGKVLPGLVRRRKHEASLYLS